MTEKLLRDVIKEAKEKKQLGIVIWSSWTTWENMGQGNKEVEDLAMEQIAEGKEATMNIKCGFSMPAFIAIPVEKFEAGEKYFNYVFTHRDADGALAGGRNDPGDRLLLRRAYESVGNDFDGIPFKLSGVRPYRNSIRNGGDHGRDLHDHGEGDGVQ